jgi:hypothetical protein
MLREDLKHITTDNLLDNNEISVRTGNCCHNAQFNTLFDIIEYYESGKLFSNIRNAGPRTCLDLKNLCKEYILKLEKHVQIIDKTTEEQQQRRESHIKSLIENDVLNAIETQQIDAVDILNYLSISQKVILEDKFKQYTTIYSIRTANRIRVVGFENFVTNYLFSSDNELYKIHGLGRKSVEEVIDLKGKMKVEFLQSINLQGEDIIKINLDRKESDVVLNHFVSDFYKINNHLPMFWILEQYLKNDNTRDVKILLDTSPIFQDKQSQILEEIATKYDLTSERVRQIRNNVFRKTFEITDDIIECKNKDKLLKYRQLLQNKDDWAYTLEFVKETDSIFEIQEYLKKEQCKLSIEFVLQIIACIFRDRFTLLGGFNTNNRDKLWKLTYLIRKEFTDIFDFEKMKEEFSNKIVDSTSNYLLDLDNYISNTQSWKQFDFEKTDEITSIVKDILLHEFGLYSEDIDGNQIKIPANKERNPLDVVYKILKAKGMPMHLDEIFIEFKKILPEHKYTQENNPDRLRLYLQRCEDITFRKRSSIYVLKEWGHIRSGTIRDNIIEFLSVNDLPQTVEAITKYVLQHFPETNQKNIHTTMFSGKNFIQFKNSLFGLASKKYSSEYEIIEQEGQRKTFEQRLTDLEKFIVENEHFPFSSSENKDEESLCQWWNRIINGKQTVSEKQQIEVERIKIKYACFKIDKNEYEWDLNYNKFKMFIFENRRVPSAKGDERFLYHWLRRAKDDFINYRLSEGQRKKYIELAKLI